MSDTDRYQRAAHAVQTGVAYDLERDPSSGTPKHLRTGVNLAMAEHAGLAQLLVRKGIITDQEYAAAMVQAAEDEAARYEALLTERYGVKITLG